MKNVRNTATRSLMRRMGGNALSVVPTMLKGMRSAILVLLLVVFGVAVVSGIAGDFIGAIRAEVAAWRAEAEGELALARRDQEQNELAEAATSGLDGVDMSTKRVRSVSELRASISSTVQPLGLSDHWQGIVEREFGDTLELFAAVDDNPAQLSESDARALVEGTRKLNWQDREITAPAYLAEVLTAAGIAEDQHARIVNEALQLAAFNLEIYYG